MGERGGRGRNAKVSSRGRGGSGSANTKQFEQSDNAAAAASDAKIEHVMEDISRRSRRTRKRNKKGTVPEIDNYGDARIQALMVGDAARTGAYHRAIMENPAIFKGKTVVDVGAGQGILSMFAAKAGAKKVYAVERSSMAEVAKALVKQNGLEEVVEVCNEDLDLLELPDKVDVIISEWMGVGLVHERMLEVVLRARDRFLKPDGHIFPTTATLYLAPLKDDGAESELYAAHTWSQPHHFGIDWTAAQKMLPYTGPDYSYEEGIGWSLQRVLVPPSRTPSKPAEFLFDLRTMSVEACKKFAFDFNFTDVDYPVCGYALWFDVDFIGDEQSVTLPTGPSDPPTHWRQLAWYYPEPMLRAEGNVLKGNFAALANEKTAGYFFSVSDSLGKSLDIDSNDFLWTECR